MGADIVDALEDVFLGFLAEALEVGELAGPGCLGQGIEVCDAELGWIDCSAEEPINEVCDYQDNDCDGLANGTDEVDDDGDGCYVLIDEPASSTAVV